jgi:hypothetical protein
MCFTRMPLQGLAHPLAYSEGRRSLVGLSGIRDGLRRARATPTLCSQSAEYNTYFAVYDIRYTISCTAALYSAPYSVRRVQYTHRTYIAEYDPAEVSETSGSTHAASSTRSILTRPSPSNRTGLQKPLRWGRVTACGWFPWFPAYFSSATRLSKDLGRPRPSCIPILHYSTAIAPSPSNESRALSRFSRLNLLTIALEL